MFVFPIIAVCQPTPRAVDLCTLFLGWSRTVVENKGEIRKINGRPKRRRFVHVKRRTWAGGTSKSLYGGGRYFRSISNAKYHVNNNSRDDRKHARTHARPRYCYARFKPYSAHKTFYISSLLLLLLLLWLFPRRRVADSESPSTLNIPQDITNYN